MINILPIKHISSDDGLIFGKLSVLFASLARLDLACVEGIVITAPELHLKTALQHFDFGHKEIFEQSLTLVKKELEGLVLPEEIKKEVGKHEKFLVTGVEINGVKKLWLHLLNNWVEEIKGRLWRDGFALGLTENLEPQTVCFVKSLEAFGSAFYQKELDEVIIQISKGKLEPRDLKELDELIQSAEKKLLINYQYDWIIDKGIKLAGIKQFTGFPVILERAEGGVIESKFSQTRSAVKIFFDLSTGLVVEKEVDGVYIQSEKVSEDLLFRLVEAANTFPEHTVLLKLADLSEGMGKIRGSLRLLHQPSLLNPLLEAADFARHKKGLTNIHLVIPFVRGAQEFMQMKRELASKNLSRKSSLQLWLEVAVPENIVNLEDYLEVGLDGVVLNMDELISHLNGFDHTEAELTFYKNEVNGLMKFLEDGLKLLHKAHIPFIAEGSLTFDSQVLEFLVEKGVYGVVAERYEATSGKDLLHLAEKRLILRKST